VSFFDQAIEGFGEQEGRLKKKALSYLQGKKKKRGKATDSAKLPSLKQRPGREGRKKKGKKDER